ncbi:hypothetical protein L1987_32494 [Smallanthus sonchifolius]|uniref:Uncharacterized protein n=1 Tax=Smallanthus sonchifolius TaxID=185202 RepID=A0ACB9HNE4_9ASTR|nr:hypothetical protein L1987_32494 [Smallanthus sonchifolius]
MSRYVKGKERKGEVGKTSALGNGELPKQRNYDLELMNKRPKEQELLENNNANSQMSSIDFAVWFDGFRVHI